MGLRSLALRFRKDGMKRLKPDVFRDICWEDCEWSKLLERCMVDDINFVEDDLADAIEAATLRTYHGCRTDDASLYFEHGLRVHAPLR